MGKILGKIQEKILGKREKKETSLSVLITSPPSGRIRLFPIMPA